MFYAGQRLQALQQVVIGLEAIDRLHYIPATDRHENVAEHTLSVATLTWFLHQHVNSPTDLNTILKYAIIHDFVEAYAGDVNTFATQQERQAKEVREQAAFTRFATEFSDFPDMLDHMLRYQVGTEPEARFVWTADKIQALILGYMDHWRTYHEQGISLEVFSQKMTELGEKVSPDLQSLFFELVAECAQTYNQSQNLLPTQTVHEA